MARNSEYQERNRPILSVLYVVAVIALVAALVLMYMNYRERRGEYQRLVKEASRSDMNLDIESRIQATQVEEDAEEVPEAAEAENAEAEAQPTDAPAIPEAPLAMDEPLNVEAKGNAVQEPSLPQLDVENSES